ncbi:MAG TPA: MFS transporter, partial [Bradyrhizobium sp.]|nr:MFS transporter [Bradyrhizobium sp.]
MVAQSEVKTMQQTSLNLRRMPEQHAASQRQPAGLAATLTLAAMSLGYGVVQLDVTIVNTALPAMALGFVL